MGESTMVSESAVCPACHFGCKLAKYQCGRGKEFYDLALAGRQVPERRSPMLTPSERAALGDDDKPPLNDRVMHAFGIVANVMQRRHAEAGERKVVLALSRAGMFMSVPIMAKRMLVPPDELADGLDAAKREGLVEVGPDDRGFEMAWLTEAGKARADAWKAERDAQTADFLSPLSDEEKETLESLVRKLLVMK